MDYDLLISLARTEEEADYYRAKKKESDEFWANFTYPEEATE
jgi:hypothetical protein